MNPSPSLQGALWSGNQQLATKRQLLSSIAGVYTDLQDLSGFEFQNIKVSTLTASQFISVPVLFVSSIVGATIDISGITIDQDGILNAPNVSLSSLSFKGFDNLLDLDVNFNLGLGDAIGGLAAGLGALVGGAVIGVGTGTGLAISGAAQGLATLVAPRTQNFISQTQFETINFTTQLQVSTLGNAYPLYSTITRTVSSVSANEVPGREIFISSFFNPGQICIRSVSDPFNLITGDSNLNTSTIQSFGQWTPLEGLEPENIVANSISANTISTGDLFAVVAKTDILDSFTVVASNVAVAQDLFMNYQAPIEFQTGATNAAAFVGNLNRLYCYNDTGYIFTSVPGTSQENASLMLGSNAGESLLTVSSIIVPGYFQAESAFISTLAVETLTVVSTINLTSTTVENITSTLTLEADNAFINNAFIQNLAPFTFASGFGTPFGPFDFGKSNTIVSTSYDQVSSLTNNILSYSMTADIQDMASFNIYNGAPVNYSVLTTNVGQWASTSLIVAGVPPGDPTGIVLAQNNASGIQGTFDLVLQGMQGSSTTPNFLVQQFVNGSMVTVASLPPQPAPVRQRFTFVNSILQAGPINPAPYQTVNSNTFTITQDINDVFITTSDRLVLTGGDIVLNGSLSVENTGFNTLTTVNLFAQQATLSTVTANVITVSSINVNSRNTGTVGGVDMTFFKPSTVSYNAAPQQVTPQTMNFTVATADFLNIYQLIPPFMGSNSFTSYNASSWNNSQFNQNTALSFGPPGVFLGDVQTSLGAYAGRFWINNAIVTPGNSVPIYVITSAGSNLLGFAVPNQYALISTSNGVTWTITSNVPNPQGNAGGFGATYSNIVNTVQTATGTAENHTQNFQLQAPATTILTGSFNMFADQVRVNSRRFGSTETAGLPSYPIGMEYGVYEDNNISWTNVAGFWQSDANNTFVNVTGDIFYDVNAWSMLVVPSRFRTNNIAILSYDVQAAVFSVGGGGFCWGFSRYIQVAQNPGSGANNWNTYMAVPLNYVTR